jgi:hypothetical protein
MLIKKSSPGLFKVVFQRDTIIALSSKMYLNIGEISCKVIKSKKNQILQAHYRNALQGNPLQEFTTKGFRIMNVFFHDLAFI